MGFNSGFKGLTKSHFFDRYKRFGEFVAFTFWIEEWDPKTRGSGFLRNAGACHATKLDHSTLYRLRHCKCSTNNSVEHNPSWKSNNMCFLGQSRLFALSGNNKFVALFTTACHFSLTIATSIQCTSPHPICWMSVLILSYYISQTLDRAMWRARFGRGFGPVVRQTTKWSGVLLYFLRRVVSILLRTNTSAPPVASAGSSPNILLSTLSLSSFP